MTSSASWIVTALSTPWTLRRWRHLSSVVPRTWYSAHGGLTVARGRCTPGWPTAPSPLRYAAGPASGYGTSVPCGAPGGKPSWTCPLLDRRSGWPLEMVLLAHRAGLRIVETGVPYRPRVGRSKVTGTLRGTVHAVNDMGALLR